MTVQKGDMINRLSGQLASFILHKHLKSGGTVEIPSLNIRITNDGVEEMEPEDKPVEPNQEVRR